jgi:hypothetical protein
MAYPDATGTTQAAVFIPELWSDEVVAAYKANLVLAALVTQFNHQGKKGDVLRLPTPARGAASAKVTNTLVDPIQSTETDLTITIDKHFEYSRLIEDIASVQALDSLRQFYTDDAGYAIATQVDTDLMQLGRGLQGGNGTIAYDKAVIGSDGSTLYIGTNEAAIADAGLREVIQTLDDANIPQRDRVLVIPPVSKNTLLGLARFTEQAFVGEVGMANSIRNGRLGNIYGVEVFVSTQCETATGAARIALMMHKSAFGLVTQVDIRTQTQYKQEYLADLLTADAIYGVGELRNDAGVAIAVVA